MIVCPELQSEGKGFLTKPSSSYAEILEKFHMDYRAHVSGESIRDSITGSTSARRGNFDPKIKGKSENGMILPRKKKKLFPDNVHQLLPSTYYLQFKDWYFHMSNDRKDCGEKDKQWFDDFKFVVKRKPSLNYQGSNSLRGGGGGGRGGFNQNKGGNYQGNAKNTYSHNSDSQNPQSPHSLRAHWDDDVNGDPNLWVNQNDNGHNKGNGGNGTNSDGKMGSGDFEDFIELNF